MWDKQIKHSLDQQDLCQHAERGRSQLKGAGRRRVGEGGHHAVNNIRHQAQQNQRGDQHQPRLPPEAHRPPGRTSLEQVLDRRKEETEKVSWPHRKNHFTGLSAALTLWLKSCREVDPSLWWRPTTCEVMWLVVLRSCSSVLLCILYVCYLGQVSLVILILISTRLFLFCGIINSKNRHNATSVESSAPSSGCCYVLSRR